MNAPLREAVRGLAQALHGRAGAREVGRVLLVVVDMPYGAVRRYARDGGIPGWLEDEVAAIARAQLKA